MTLDPFESTYAYSIISFDLLNSISKDAHNPQKVAKYLTLFFRELTGAKLIVFIDNFTFSDNTPPKIIHFTPERRKQVVSSKEFTELTCSLIKLETAQYFNETDNSPLGKSIKKIFPGISAYFPISSDGNKEIGIFLLGLPELHHIEKVVFLVNSLSTTISAIFHNAVLYEQMEFLSQKKARKLVEKEYQVKRILRSAIDGFWIVDPNGKFLEVNYSAAKMLGYTEQEMLKLSILDIEHYEEINDIKKHMLSIQDKGEDRFESRHKCKDGSIIDVEVNAIWDQVSHCFYTFIHDITNRKKTEKFMIENQRLGAIGEMASSVAHDFNNSLQAIMGNLELVLLEAEQFSPETIKRLETVLKLSTDAASRIKLLHRFGSKENEQTSFSKINLNILSTEVIEQSRHLFNKLNPISTETVFQDIPFIQGNQGELRTAIFNMVKNSVEAMPDGGTLIFKTGFDQDKVFLSIIDNGIGMSQEAQKRLFQPFFSTKGFEVGRGLGMSGVYTIVREHQGDIFIQYSSPQQGTCIRMEFPVFEDNDVDTKNSSCSLEKKFEPSLLWIEDDESIRNIYQKFMQKMNCKGDIVESGVSALQLLNEKQYDLIISDLAMPEMNGWELVEKIRKKFGKKHVIALITGWASSITEKEKKQNQIDFYLSKPVRLFEFKKLLQEILELKQNKSISS